MAVAATNAMPPATRPIQPDGPSEPEHLRAAPRAGARGYLVKGADGAEIVRAVQAVRNHVSQLLLKLQVPDRTAAALKAREAGLGNRL